MTFTIDGTEYTAELGMTWGEWCESEYNTDGFYTEEYMFGTAVYAPSSSLHYLREGSAGNAGTVVDSTDEIDSGTLYCKNTTNSPLPA